MRHCKVKNLFKLVGNPQLNKESFTFGNNSQYPYFTRTVFNNGILGYVDYLDDAHLIKGNSLAVGMMGMRFFYMEHDFYAGQFTKTAFPLFDGFNEKVALWFIAWFNRMNPIYLSVLVRDFEKTFYETELIVPYIHGKVAISFIESRVRELEEERVRELEAYLKAAGFEDCALSTSERETLSNLSSGVMCSKEFKISELFTQHRGKEKAPNQVPDGDTPLINETSVNNGFTRLVRPTKVFAGNAITISINYATTVYYQYKDFCASVNISILKNDNILNRPEIALYFVALLRKNNQQYDYNRKISKDKINDTYLSLPVTEDGKIDYTFMETAIRAMEKQCIARLKAAFAQEHGAYRQVIS